MFQITSILKMTEQDDFEQGCIGPYQDQQISMILKDATLEGLITKFAEFCGCDAKDVERNVCDEDGRIECQRTEDAEGYELSDAQTEAWKAGRAKAYAATYTGYVYHCVPVAV